MYIVTHSELCNLGKIDESWKEFFRIINGRDELTDYVATLYEIGITKNIQIWKATEIDYSAEVVATIKLDE